MKYTVSIKLTETYEVLVEAESEAKAINMAMEVFNNGNAEVTYTNTYAWTDTVNEKS